MLRRGRMSLNIKAPQPLRALLAVGLRSEVGPSWPLPLPPPLPKQANKRTLVLDIDETLIHTCCMMQYSPDNEALCVGPPTNSNNTQDDASPEADPTSLIHYQVLVRPYLKEFLEEVHQLFEVVFWTAGTASYCAAIVDAMERQVLHLPRSMYNCDEMMKRRGTSPDHVASPPHTNFLALSRSQTLQEQGYMKYLPMLGRPMSSVVMLDDNVRSFPLNPRHGIKIDPFEADDRTLSRYMYVANQTKHLTKAEKSQMDKSLLLCLLEGKEELERLSRDRSLLDIMPMLRALAKTPPTACITAELDHWRVPSYIKCDDFSETMNPLTAVRQNLLGTVTRDRQTVPIPPLKSGPRNKEMEKLAKQQMQHQFMRFSFSKL